MSLVKSLYSSYLSPITTKFGMDKLIRDTYWVYKINRNPVVEQDIAGIKIKFNVTNRIEYRRHQTLGGETEIIEDLLSEIDSDDIVFDIGANVGTYTCFLSKKLTADHVVAFEPHPKNIEALRANLELNNTGATIVQRALANRDGNKSLKVASSQIGEGKHSLASGRDQDTIDIKWAVGDRLIDRNEVPSPTVVKIDVEGAEYQVLEGLENALSQQNCRLCYIEVHPERLTDYGHSESDINTLLDAYGFEHTRISERGSEYFIKGVK